MFMETFGGNVWSEICCRNLVGEIGGFFLEEIPYLILDFDAEVNISSYPARILAGLFFFCRAEILNSGGFVQKYSDQGVSCKNIGQ